MAGYFQENCWYNLLGVGCTVLLLTAFPIAQITIGAVYIHECPAAPVIPVYVMVCGILALMIMGLFALPKPRCPVAPDNTFCTLCVLSLVLFVFIWFFYGSYQIYSVYLPNYTKTIINQSKFSSTVYTPTAPENKPTVTMENLNQSISNFNQTWIMNNNQTFLGNISNQTNRERLNASQQPLVTAVAHYCNRTLYLFAFWTTTLVYVFVGNALVIIICLYGFVKIINNVIPMLIS